MLGHRDIVLRALQPLTSRKPGLIYMVATLMVASAAGKGEEFRKGGQFPGSVGGTAFTSGVAASSIKGQWVSERFRSLD